MICGFLRKEQISGTFQFHIINWQNKNRENREPTFFATKYNLELLEILQEKLSHINGSERPATCNTMGEISTCTVAWVSLNSSSCM